MPSPSFTAGITDGWDMYQLAEEQWSEWVEEPGSLRKALLGAILGNHVLDWTWYRNCDSEPLPTFVVGMRITKPGEAGYVQFRKAVFTGCDGTRKLQEIANGTKARILVHTPVDPGAELHGRHERHLSITGGFSRF
jgi:hypothetical protein